MNGSRSARFSAECPDLSHGDTGDRRRLVTMAATAPRVALGMLLAAIISAAPAMAAEAPGVEGDEPPAVQQQTPDEAGADGLVEETDGQADEAEETDDAEGTGETEGDEGRVSGEDSGENEVVGGDQDAAEAGEGSGPGEPAADAIDVADVPAEGLPQEEPALGEADPSQQAGTAGDALLQAAQTGPFAVEGGVYGTDYRYQDGTLTVLTSTPIAISMAEAGTTTGDSIVVASGAPANVTLHNVSIDCSATGDGERTFGTAAFDVRSGGVNLTIKGSVTLKSGSMQAGLQAGSLKHSTASCPIAIDAMNDSLHVYGGYGAAGIGTGYGAGCSAGITITGGYIYAYGGEGAAGIGGAKGAWGSNISVPDIAHVWAYGGAGGAGIGGGLQQYGKDITLSSGVVRAYGGDGAAGIGNGADAHTSADGILIERSVTLSAYGGSDAAAIGGGRGSGLVDCTVTGGYVLLARGGGDTEPIGHGSRSVVSGRTLVGGYFVEGNKDDGTVYGMKVADGYRVEEVTRIQQDEFYDFHVVPVKSVENPSNPEGPTKPENPEGPANPGESENPENPGSPEEPGVAENPSKPAVPAKPAAPVANQVPKTTDATEAPVALAAAGGVALGMAAGLLARLRGLGRKRG